MENKRSLNVRDYGATGLGDGHDDGPAFRLAITALKALGGGKLYAPAGRYFLGKITNGYANGQYEITTNTALLVDFSNFAMEGDGMGATVLEGDATTSLLYVRGPDLRNITLRDLTFEQPDAAAEYANTRTAFVLKGLNPAKATSFIDQGWTLSSMVYIEGTQDHMASNVSVNRCELKNPVRHGLCLGHTKNVRILDNLISYYDGFGPPEFSGHATGAGRCGIFSGFPVRDVLVQGNNFNGNVSARKPVGSTATGYAWVSADGFVWFAKGGGISVLGNTVRNYGLEASQIEALPCNVKGNLFDTETGTPSAVACIAYPCTDRELERDCPIIIFSDNTVRHRTSPGQNGGGIGFETKGPVWAYDGNLPTARCRVVADGNIFEGVDVVFGGVSMDSFQCSHNVVTDCDNFFVQSLDPLDTAHPKQDFRNTTMTFASNIITRCRKIPFMLNGPLSNGGVLTLLGNVTDRGSSYHLALGYPKDGETYNIMLKANVWLNPDGVAVQVPVVAYLPLPDSVRFLGDTLTLGKFLA
jgi:hypothetical protein